ncbi:MAG: hypothetical protein JST67_06955 [Bacteroidetes bacterium]|nr:hypothetical protein [Bacteroidota bacterium]
MKKVWSLLSLSILFFALVSTSSCGEKSEQSQNPLADSLATDNSNLKGELSEKEASLQNFVNGFNDIQSTLDSIKEKEKIVSNVSQTGDVKSKEEQIQQDIQSIYALMAKNKSRIASLSKKLKTANTKIDGLEKMLASLEAQLNEKDAQINDLKNQLQQKNIELSNLNANYESLQQESNQKTVQINTVYYIIGTGKELKADGVTEKEGGFIGLGKTTEIKKDFAKDKFTKVDASQTTEIPIGAKKVKILTSHPSSSYKLVGEKPVQKIEITNTTDFWSASKYLVILAE